MTAYRIDSLDCQYPGVCAGIVEDNEDPEKEGRVKVRFLWMDNRTISDWCRVCQPYAGNGYGALFIPERGDEVLVSFVHGDMVEPIVIGGLYNGEDKPSAYKQGAQQDKKLIRTKAGHQLLFDDGSGSRATRLTTAGGHAVDLDDKEQKVTVSSSGGHQLVLDDKGMKVSLASKLGHKVELDDRGMKVTIANSSGTASIEFDPAGRVTVRGTAISITAPMINIGP